MPDSVPIESEDERCAREEDEMAALDVVGDYKADPTVTLEDVPQDIVFKTMKVCLQDSEGVVCMCYCVGVCVCVCVCARARRRYALVRICICIL